MLRSIFERKLCRGKDWGLGGSVVPKFPLPPNPQSLPLHSFLSKIDLSVASPSVCLNSYSVVGTDDCAKAVAASIAVIPTMRSDLRFHTIVMTSRLS